MGRTTVVAGDGETAEVVAPVDTSAPTTQEEADKRMLEGDEKNTQDFAKQSGIKLSNNPDDCKLGEKYTFYNPTKWDLKCPYSKATFPSGNLTPSAVEANQWIRSQVGAGTLAVQLG